MLLYSKEILFHFRFLLKKVAILILTGLLSEGYNSSMKLKVIIILAVLAIFVGVSAGVYLAISRGRLPTELR